MAEATGRRTRRASAREGASEVQSVNVAEKLEQFCVQEWDVPKANITTAENSRQCDRVAVEQLKENIAADGWMTTSYPKIMFTGLAQGEKMTQQLADTLQAVTLDGNHRVQAHREFFGNTRPTIRCVCYSFISCAYTRRIASDVCNKTSEQILKRSTYDQLFFYSTLISAVAELRGGNTEAGNMGVKPGDLQECWKGVGGAAKAPALNTLRSWLNACKSTSADALLALRTLTADRVSGYKSITLTFLGDPRVAGLLKEPRTQALVVNLYARLNPTKKKAAPQDGSGGDAIGHTLLRARTTMAWIGGIESVVPRAEWSEKLTKDVQTFSYGKLGHYAQYVKPHQDDIESELRQLKSSLPSHITELPDNVVSAVRSQQLMTFKSAMSQDNSLRPKLEESSRRYIDATNYVERLKLQLNDPPSNDKTGDDTAGAMGCLVCKGPPSSTYVCSKCGIHHTGGCENTIVPSDERMKARDCKDCERSKHPNNKRSAPGGDGSGEEEKEEEEEEEEESSGPSRASPGGKKNSGKGKNKARRTSTDPSSGAATTLPRLPATPTGSTGETKAIRRDECITVHDLMPLSRDFRIEDRGDLTLNNKAMLLFLAPGANEDLLKEGATWKGRLTKLVYSVSEMMHQKGTIIAHIPQPHHLYDTQIHDALTQPDVRFTVEDHGLVVMYGKRGGGIKSPAKANHLASGVDKFLVAHPDGADFTCNVKVLPQAFPGMVCTSGAPPTPNEAAESVMIEVPRLMTSRCFHSNVASWAVQRFTKQGDTVVTLSADKDRVVEAALQWGRKVELFVSDPGERASVCERAERAFETPWQQGIFPRDSTGKQIHKVKTGSLPLGIPDGDTTPPSVLESVQTRSASDTSLSAEKVTVAQATKLAVDLGWDIRPEDDSADLALFAKNNAGYRSGTQEIPLWGTYFVYDTRQAALATLSPNDDDPSLQYVRLVMVADNSLLKQMCNSKEQLVVSAGAALYLEVAPTCPAYYALWGSSEHGLTHEIRNTCSRKDTTEQLLKRFNNALQGEPTPLRITTTTDIPPKAKGVHVTVAPGASVVRTKGWCSDDDEDAGGDSDGGDYDVATASVS